MNAATTNILNGTGVTDPAPQASTLDDQPSRASAPKARNGKVARLPYLERDMINRMLRNNIPHEKIVEAVGFHGFHVTERNISTWKTRGGYREWCDEQDRSVQTRHFQDNLLEHLRTTDASNVAEVGLQLSATYLSQFFVLPSTRDKMLAEPEKQVRTISALCRLAGQIHTLQKYRDDCSKELGGGRNNPLVVNRVNEEEIETTRNTFSAESIGERAGDPVIPHRNYFPRQRPCPDSLKPFSFKDFLKPKPSNTANGAPTPPSPLRGEGRGEVPSTPRNSAGNDAQTSSVPPINNHPSTINIPTAQPSTMHPQPKGSSGGHDAPTSSAAPVPQSAIENPKSKIVNPVPQSPIVTHSHQTPPNPTTPRSRLLAQRDRSCCSNLGQEADPIPQPNPGSRRGEEADPIPQPKGSSGGNDAPTAVPNPSTLNNQPSTSVPQSPIVTHSHQTPANPTTPAPNNTPAAEPTLENRKSKIVNLKFPTLASLGITDEVFEAKVIENIERRASLNLTREQAIPYAYEELVSQVRSDSLEAGIALSYETFLALKLEAGMGRTQAEMFSRSQSNTDEYLAEKRRRHLQQLIPLAKAA